MKRLLLALLLLTAATVSTAAQTVTPSSVYTNWSPIGAPTLTTINGVSSAHLFPSAGPTARFCNQGSNDVFLNPQGVNNSVSATTGGLWLKAGGCQSYNLKPFGTQYTYWAGITAGGSTTLYVETGIGAPAPNLSVSVSGGGGPVTVAGGADTTEGTIGDTHTTGTVVGFLKDTYTALTAGPVPVNAVTLNTLQTAANGILTTINTNTLGVANTVSSPGTPQTSALSIQGNAAGVPVPVSGSVTISGGATAANQATEIASLATIATNTTAPTTVAQPTAANLNATVVGTGTFATQAAQSGAWNVTNVSGTVSLPTGASTAANQATANTSLATIATNTTNAGTPTDAADGPVTAGAVSTKSQLAGGQYNSTVPALTTGQQAAVQVDANGALVTVPYSIKSSMARGTGSGNDTAAHTIIVAGGGGLKTYITSMQCSNTSATSTLVTLNDAAASVLIVPAGGGNNPQFSVPLVTAAATAFTLTSGTAVTTVYCNAQGYYAP